MFLIPGTRLGTYEILSPIGAGGMGEVYRARDTRLGREVAVKVLPEAVASSPGSLARFEREARTVAGLNHPNIVVLHSVEEEDGIRFLTMELVEGQSLSQLISPGGLPLARVLDLSIPIADALVVVHERGVVHRDLKPGNVMVTREGRVKVLDFGLAKAVELESYGSQTLTATAPLSGVGQVVGTVPYMAPEQVRGEAVDARTDLFALGIILYQLATGRRPFTGATSADVSSAILRDAPRPLRSLRGDFPRDFDRIIGRCLEKDPERRIQTAKDVRNELELVRRAGKSVAPPASRASQDSVSAPIQDVPSIAVLPFVNRSRGEDDEYFSDGLADELLNVLAKIRGLRVAARSSSFRFKGKNEDLAVIGRKLHVATILEGSVRKVANRVRIAVQLVKVSDGYHLWSEIYDRTLEDIFAVQDDIAQSVVKELRTRLLGEALGSEADGDVKADVAAAVKGRGQNAEAHRLYLQGRHFLGGLTRGDVTRAIGYLRHAVELDESYALAWAELGRAYLIEAERKWVPLAEGTERARKALESALTLEPDLAEGHGRLAVIQIYYDWDRQSGEASYRRALALAPENPTVIGLAGMLACTLGEFEDAIALYRRALAQDPLVAGAYYNLGISYHWAGYLAEAEEALRKALELSPQRVSTRSVLAEVLLAQGREGEALEEVMREPDERYQLQVLALIHHAAGREADSHRALRELIEKYAETEAYEIAEVHCARREIDAAFEWLERAYTQHSGALASMEASPGLRPLHGDPRWGVFLSKMGLAR